jgi:hypothetical protein
MLLTTTAQAHTWHAIIEVESDPADAHIYGSDGSYWGLAHDPALAGTAVSRYFTKDVEDGETPDDVSFGIVAKIRNHPAAKQRFSIHYYSDKATARAHAQKVMVVIESSSCGE